jgi:teichuronic acid biosynthesis glycosyltransferase TuaG
MPTPRDISVIIPYFNREQYIDQAVQSVLAQTLPPLEIIIVNDGSREASRRYLDRYAQTCVVVDLPTTRGASAARNEGIHRARGRYIGFLDDDDIWLPEKLAIQRRYMDEHPECAIAHSAAWSFASDRTDFLCSCDWPAPLTLAQALTHDHWVILPTMLARSDVLRALGGFDTKFRGSEDHDLTIRCAAAGYRIEGISEPLVRFRRDGHQSLTRRRWQMFLTHIRLTWKHRRHYHRAYGIRGMVSFLLATLHIAASQTRYVDGAVRRLLRIFKVEYRNRPGYRDPVLSRPHALLVPTAAAISVIPAPDAQDSHA